MTRRVVRREPCLVAVALLAVALLSLAACKNQPESEARSGTVASAAAREPAAAPRGASSAKAAPHADDGTWKKRESAEGGYTVVGLTSGTVQHSSTQTVVGLARTTTVLYQNEGYPGALMVMYMDMPVPDGTSLAEDRGLEDGRDRAVAAYHGTLTSDERVQVDGYPAREFEFDGSSPQMGDVHVFMRGAFRDRRVYMVASVAAKGDAEHQKLGRDFVRSFSILPYVPSPDPAQVTETTPGGN